jgi:hypothetical protein
VASLLLVGGCTPSDQQLRDLERVPARDPGKAEIFNNVNDYPNLVLLCIHGKAFMTSTRDYKPWERETDLDSVCTGTGQ